MGRVKKDALVYDPSTKVVDSKSKYPQLAYEWDNYRLTTREINTRKGDDDEIADPFEIKHGWFVLGLPDCLIWPGADISPRERRTVQQTIDTLKLNDDDDYPNGRQNIIQSYIDDSLDLDCLRRRYPFIAYELKRQNLLSVEKLRKCL